MASLYFQTSLLLEMGAKIDTIIVRNAALRDALELDKDGKWSKIKHDGRNIAICYVIHPTALQYKSGLGYTSILQFMALKLVALEMARRKRKDQGSPTPDTLNALEGDIVFDGVLPIDEIRRIMHDIAVQNGERGGKLLSFFFDLFVGSFS